MAKVDVGKSVATITHIDTSIATVQKELAAITQECEVSVADLTAAVFAVNKAVEEVKAGRISLIQSQGYSRLFLASKVNGLPSTLCVVFSRCPSKITSFIPTILWRRWRACCQRSKLVKTRR